MICLVLYAIIRIQHIPRGEREMEEEEKEEKEEEEKKKKKNGEKRIKRGEILPCCIASCSFAVFHYSILESVRS